MDTQVLYQIAIILATPTVASVIGTSVAALLAQDGFPDIVNGVIAWAVLLICAVASAYTGGQLVGDPAHIVGAIEGVATLLISGGLAALKPYLAYLNFLETYLFRIVGPVSQFPGPTPSVKPTVHDWTRGNDGR